MTVIIPTGFAAISAEMRNESDPDSWFITWAVDVSASGGSTEDILEVSRFAFGESVLQIMNNTITFVQVNARIGTDGGAPAIAVLPDGRDGSAGQNMLPQNCAMLVDKFTALPGRKGRGRMFVPGVLDETKVSEVGIIQSAERTLLQEAMDRLLENLAEPPGGTRPPTPMVLLHNGVGLLTPDPTPVTALSVQATISTQRRRLR